jgi:hypothetical protein
MWTFANFRTIASQRWPAATSASLIWLGFSLALVALIPACGGEIRLEPSVMEEGLEPSDAKESLETNIPAESRERSDEDSELGTLSQALTQTRFDANWTCPAGVTCEDTYDFTIPQGTRVQIAVSGLTGGSIPRMAALVAGSGNNLLTNDTRDWTCSDSNSVLFVAPTSGNYQLKIGRDGSSPGTTGQYTVIFEGNPSMTFLRVSGNDTTTAKQRTCGWETAISASYSCSAGAGCMNVYDFDVPVAGVASARVSGPANVSLSLSLWGPGRGPGNDQLFRGRSGAGWRCAASGAQQATQVQLRQTGRFRFAVTYEVEGGGPSSGNYATALHLSQPARFLGQTVANGPRLSGQSGCGFEELIAGTWNCSSGDVKCVDVFSVNSATAQKVRVSIGGVTGLSTPRLAVRQSQSVNALNGLNSDRQCVGADLPDFADTITNVGPGDMTLTYGRSRGNSGGAYIGAYSATHALTSPLLSINDGTTNFSTSCP